MLPRWYSNVSPTIVGTVLFSTLFISMTSLLAVFASIGSVLGVFTSIVLLGLILMVMAQLLVDTVRRRQKGIGKQIESVELKLRKQSDEV